MARFHSKIFIGTLVVFLLDLKLCSSGSLDPMLKCKLPDSTTRWDSNPEKIIMDVYWGSGGKSICYTTNTCFGQEVITQGQGDSNGDEKTTTNDAVAVQLHPVQLQKGNKLRFHLVRHSQGSYPRIYKVDETAFSMCNISEGSRVQIAGDDIVDVPPEVLECGHNYFMVDDQSLISCYLGLRLNVTVKREMCTGNDLDACGGRGLCVTNKHQPDYACHCCGTYKGDNCSIFDACLSHPCKNGGECLHGDNGTDGYQCKCPIGYSGDHCEHKALNLCDLIQCRNNGTCTGSNTTFHCACAPGWRGSECEVDIDDCERWPCLHGLCVDKLNGYECHCFPGYHGPNCQQQHTKCTFGPCEKYGGFCENQTTGTDFKYRCHCPHGSSGKDCSDKKPVCDPNPCSLNTERCEEKTNSFKCICRPGWTGNLCEVNINDCNPNPCLYGGHCVDLRQGHICSCIQTHFGSNCQFTQYMYRPGLSGIDTNVVIVRDTNETMLVLAWVLSIGVAAVIFLLIGCYCRLTESYKGLCGLRTNKKADSDLTVEVKVSNTPDRPLTSDAFFKGSQSDLGIDNVAYKNECV